MTFIDRGLFNVRGKKKKLVGEELSSRPVWRNGSVSRTETESKGDGLGTLQCVYLPIIRRFKPRSYLPSSNS
jgi:hypothetical protein